MAVREILVIDDEQDMLKVMTFVLSSKGFKVHTALDGAEAIEKLKDLQPQLIFLDLEMPHLGGLDVCENIKEQPRLREIPIVILTAHAMTPEEQSRLDKMQIRSCLQKPFAIEQILAVLRQWEESE